MGLSLSSLLSATKEILRHRQFGVKESLDALMLRSINFDSKLGEILRTVSFKRGDLDNTNKSNSVNFRKWKPENLTFETRVSFKNLALNGGKSSIVGELIDQPNPSKSLPEPAIFFSPRPVGELDAAALKVQKVYKSYRTRRNLADCAVVVEELWWKALDFADLNRSSVSFFNVEKPESAISRWARARTRVAKVGKGLSKDEKAQKLALSHWLEAIDPRHRYGHNLHLYYNVWFDSQSSQPFFYWLDVGDGKEVNLEKCPRTTLQRQCITYLGPKERELYEVIIDTGKLVYKRSGVLVDTVENSKWIFVLSTSRNLYVAQKKKGLFQHSSFLAGAATTAAGRLVAHNGILEAIWPYSGHYHPTEENFMEFISFLGEHHVDLSNVKRYAIDEDDPFLKVTSDEDAKSDSVRGSTPAENISSAKDKVDTSQVNGKAPVFEPSKRLSAKWSTGAGPRIGCVREYPAGLQSKALEKVNLSPRVMMGAPFGTSGPIPSPRPSPRIHLSPKVANMGLPSPRVLVPKPN